MGQVAAPNSQSSISSQPNLGNVAPPAHVVIDPALVARIKAAASAGVDVAAPLTGQVVSKLTDTSIDASVASVTASQPSLGGCAQAAGISTKIFVRERVNQSVQNVVPMAKALANQSVDSSVNSVNSISSFFSSNG